MKIFKDLKIGDTVFRIKRDNTVCIYEVDDITIDHASKSISYYLTGITCLDYTIDINDANEKILEQSILYDFFGNSYFVDEKEFLVKLNEIV